MRISIVRILLILVLTGAALAQAPAPAAKAAPKAAATASFQTTGTLLQVMTGVIGPAADVVFEAGNNPPKDDAGWQAAQNAALTVSEAANLMMIGNRAQGRTDWNQLSRALIAAGQKTYKAALAKDGDAMLDAGGPLAEACDACHQKYLNPVRDAAERAKAKAAAK